jgi:hypothetical protein
VHVEAEQRARREPKRFAVAVTVVHMSRTPGALDAVAFKHLLAESQLFPKRMRTGSVYFDATRVAARLATHSGYDPEAELEILARWAASVGGEVDESGLLRLPAQRFGDAGNHDG